MSNSLFIDYFFGTVLLFWTSIKTPKVLLLPQRDAHPRLVSAYNQLDATDTMDADWSMDDASPRLSTCKDRRARPVKTMHSVTSGLFTDGMAPYTLVRSPSTISQELDAVFLRID